MDGMHCPHFASSRLVLASVPSRFINHTQSTTKLNRGRCRTISLPFLKGFFFLPLQANTSLSVLMLPSAYQPSTPCMLYFLFFPPPLSSPYSRRRRIALVPIILTTAKFERVQPKTVKLHQSSLVQCIDWCQEQVTTCLDTENAL